MYIPFIILINDLTGDDITMFQNKFSTEGFWNFTLNRYQTWTSRNIIEAITVTFCSININFWKVINFIFIVILYRCLCYLFTDDSTKSRLYVVLSFGFLPLSFINETGWVSISTTYIWTLCLLLVSLLPFKNVKEGNNLFIWITSYICMIIGCNMESNLILLIFISISYSIYMIKNKIKPNVYMIIYALLALLSLIYFLTCPGNHVRNNVSSTSVFNHEYKYELYSIVDKTICGFLNTAIYYFVNYNYKIIFMVLLILYLCIFFIKPAKLHRDKIQNTILITITTISFILSYFIEPLDEIGTLLSLCIYL